MKKKKKRCSRTGPFPISHQVTKSKGTTTIFAARTLAVILLFYSRFFPLFTMFLVYSNWAKYIYIYFAQPFFPLFPSSPLSSPHVLTLFLPICTFLFCHALLLLSARILFYHSACTFPLMFITFIFFLSCFRIETKKKKKWLLPPFFCDFWNV